MPTRRLPSRPELDQLKRQAKELVTEQRSGTLQACQRIREFHPKHAGALNDSIKAAPFTLSDAQLAIAREYGFPSWARLRTYVHRTDRPDLARPKHEQIENPAFRTAVDLLDGGDTDGLRAHLMNHPGLVHQRVTFEGGNYFSNPTLLEFVAENPIRHDALPPNIVEVARTILEAE